MDKEFKNGKTTIDVEYIEMLINNFNAALSNDSDVVYIGYEIITDDDLKEYSIHKKDWERTLEILLKKAIEIEEYEYCSTITELIDEIKNVQ